MNSKEQHLKFSSNLRAVLVVAICIIFIGCLAALVQFPIPEENRSAVDILVGSVSTLLGMVFTYYFGNSAGSTKKRNPSTEEETFNLGEDPHGQ